MGEKHSIKIPLLNTIYKNRLLIDLFENSNNLKGFHNGTNLDAIDENFLASRDLSSNKRKILVNTIKEQYLKADIKIPLNVDKLSNNGVFTITTGHQLCLFGGPQFFIHKIISVIVLCEKLKKKFPNYQFIPFFWLASEDHDFKEISSLHIFNKQIGVDGEDSIGVGKLNPQIFASAFSELKEIFKNDERFKQLEKIFSNSFLKKDLSTFTRYWVSEIFKEEDLIIIDPDDKDLKQLFIPTMNEEIANQFVFNTVKSTNKKLLSYGYKPKINPRNLNLFYLSQDKRHRIILDQNLFHIGDAVFNKIELQQKLIDNPENFSPNVLLRPLYQESILPNLIYVGGPSEIAYWTQLKESFDSSSINYPILMLRDHFSWLSKKKFELWEKIGFSENDLIKSESELNRKFIEINFDVEFNIKVEKKLLGDLEKSLVNKAELIDSSLVPMVKGMVKGMNNSLDKSKQKFFQAIKRTQQEKLSQIQKINTTVIEKGVLKERKESFIAPYLLSSNYISALKNHSSCEDKSLKILIY